MIRITTLHIQKRPSSEEGTAADTVQAMYAEWPLEDILLKHVVEGDRTVFQTEIRAGLVYSPPKAMREPKSIGAEALGFWKRIHGE